MCSEQTVMEGLEGRWTHIEKPGLRGTGGPQACSPLQVHSTEPRKLEACSRLSSSPSCPFLLPLPRAGSGSAPTCLQKDCPLPPPLPLPLSKAGEGGAASVLPSGI